MLKKGGATPSFDRGWNARPYKRQCTHLLLCLIKSICVSGIMMQQLQCDTPVRLYVKDIAG